MERDKREQAGASVSYGSLLGLCPLFVCVLCVRMVGHKKGVHALLEPLSSLFVIPFLIAALPPFSPNPLPFLPPSLPLPIPSPSPPFPTTPSPPSLLVFPLQSSCSWRAAWR